MFLQRKIFILAWFMIFYGITQGQDLHFSYYQFTPVDVNPAMSGAFSGSYRLNGIYSHKEMAATNHPFQTFAVSADAPIVRGLRKQDWIGVGLHADVLSHSGDIPTDLAGAGRDHVQTLSFIKIAASYHLALNKKQTRIFTLGLQMSNANRNYAFLNPGMTRVNMMYANMTDLDQQGLNNLKGTGGGSGGANQDQNIRYSYRDFRTGLLYNARGKNSDLKLGLAFNGLFRPYVGTSAMIPRRRLSQVLDPNNPGGISRPPKDSVDTRYLGLNFHGELTYDIDTRLSVVPSFFFYSLGPANAFNANTHVWYKVNPEKDFKAGLGLGMRNARDVLFFLGAQFGDYRAGIAYDMPISDKTIATGPVSGFEICITYLGKIYKKPKVEPVVFCPRL